jgi:hypothetical protein
LQYFLVLYILPFLEWFSLEPSLRNPQTFLNNDYSSSAGTHLVWNFIIFLEDPFYHWLALENACSHWFSPIDSNSAFWSNLILLLCDILYIFEDSNLSKGYCLFLLQQQFETFSPSWSSPSKSAFECRR